MMMPHVILQSALGSFYVESEFTAPPTKKISKSIMFGLLGGEQTTLQDFEWDNAGLVQGVFMAKILS